MLVMLRCSGSVCSSTTLTSGQHKQGRASCLPIQLSADLLRSDNHSTATPSDTCQAGKHTMHSQEQGGCTCLSRPKLPAFQKTGVHDKSHPLLTSISFKRMRDGCATAADAWAFGLAWASSSLFLCRAVSDVGMRELRPLLGGNATGTPSAPLL